MLNKDFSSAANLISTTDPSSHITYANSDFCDIAGYKEQALVGNPHNIVRHKDMPKAAFKQMWDYLKSGQSWMGLVKNQCSDNQHHYWVSAFVTPIRDPQDNIVEYQSVRSKPSKDQIQRAGTLYKQLNENKASHRPRIKFHTINVAGMALLTASLLTSAISMSNWLLGLPALLSLVLLASTHIQKRRFNQLLQLSKQAYENELMEKPYTNHKDDYSQIELALMMRKAELRAVSARASETSGKILISAEEEFGTIQSIDQGLQQQCSETEQVATAVEELTNSINEVSTAATESSQLTVQANTESQKGLSSIEETIAEVDALNEELTRSQSIINQLSDDSQKIDSILEVITAISEQTNLLALNAAIEAARAGEAGRGFAVVADEVRNLASKTGSSANEIHAMIKQLQDTASQAVEAMQNGNQLSNNCKQRADQTGDVLRMISAKLDSVTDSSHQIAVAVEQQACVTQEINRNIINIKQLADNTSETSQTSIERTSRLVDSIEAMQRLMTQFNR
ncbi:PAS domain-containing methyl-accepting chemotaxis protein [Vibrio sp. CAU 1672]|uniref:methyl-accepting chemotaxis protein n=1 Tax=Vibrio sp. CAU 1672 TaxID=3032594 RepID=UPI0023DAAE4A|nr:PAS domain-containing methyl-accepting chemotaxis protein [Vibrio sp. CAU 1672]MDF2156140.1 PAS domain-containing methyl-accepting chemotaxis protein [Vibrio sp. CAU 1672]